MSSTKLGRPQTKYEQESHKIRFFVEDTESDLVTWGACDFLIEVIAHLEIIMDRPHPTHLQDHLKETTI